MFISISFSEQAIWQFPGKTRHDFMDFYQGNVTLRNNGAFKNAIRSGTRIISGPMRCRQLKHLHKCVSLDGGHATAAKLLHGSESLNCGTFSFVQWNAVQRFFGLIRRDAPLDLYLFRELIHVCYTCRTSSQAAAGRSWHFVNGKAFPSLRVIVQV